MFGVYQNRTKLRINYYINANFFQASLSFFQLNENNFTQTKNTPWGCNLPRLRLKKTTISRGAEEIVLPSILIWSVPQAVTRGNS